MRFIFVFPLFLARSSQQSTTISDQSCGLGTCDIVDDLEDFGLHLLQKGSSVWKSQHAKHMTSSAGSAEKSAGNKYDPENDVYNDVDIGQKIDAGVGSSSFSPSGSSSYSPSGSASSSPSSPSPTPTAAPSPTPASTSAPSPTPASTASPTPAPTASPSTAAPTATATATATATRTVTTTHTHMTSTTTTTYHNQTKKAGYAAAGHRGRGGYRGPGAIGGAFLGLILFIYSFIVNWKTEKAATQMDTLIARVDAECKTVDADKADPTNRNSLVLVSGKLSSPNPVQDKRFNVSSDQIGIDSTLYVYKTPEDDDLFDDEGGKGKGKGNGKGKGKDHEERKPRWTLAKMGYRQTLCNRASLGSGFSFDLADFFPLTGADMFEHLTWKPKIFGSEVTALSQEEQKQFGKTFKKAPDNKYYTGDKDKPKENDYMVEFREALSGSCTVMALQVANESDPQKDTFLPYTLVPHACPCYSADSEQEQEALLEGGKQALANDKDLSNEMNFWSCVTCSFCFGVMFRPEVFMLNATKTISKERIIQGMNDAEYTKKWGCRLVGYLMLFFGIAWMFMPISDVLHFIPLIGGILSGLVGFVIWVFAFLVSIAIYLLIKIVAAAYFNPMWAFIYTGILVVFIVLISVLGGSSGTAHHKF